MKKIINTTKDRLEVQIFGNPYILEAMGSLIVTKKVADYWTNNLHQFLDTEEILENKGVEVKEIKEEVKEVKEVKKTK
jgi:hypothetical protein